jgi:hypothetical protein
MHEPRRHFINMPTGLAAPVVLLGLFIAVALGLVCRVPQAYAFDPSSLSGLQAWYKADSLTAASGTSIGTWTDSSGNGHTMASSTNNGAALPVFYPNQINGEPALDFPGTYSDPVALEATNTFSSYLRPLSFHIAQSLLD